MNKAQVIDKAIKLIAQYSNGGVLVDASQNLDYTYKASELIDQAQKKVATRSKIHAVASYSQYPIEPINGKYYGFKMAQFLPGTTDDLIDIQGTDAKSFYFEANWNCECYIEESDDQITWTTVASITSLSEGTTTTANPIIVSSDLVYKSFKGFITATKDYVRLRFTSNYPFVVRNRALWTVPFATETQIPIYAPKLEVEVNSTKWQEFNKVVQKTDDRTYLQMLDFSSIGRKTFIMDYFYTGSFDIHYYKVPEDVTTATADTTELEVYPGMAQEAIPYYVGGHMILDEYPTLALVLLNEFQAIYQELETNEIPGARYISNTTGW